MFSHAIVKTPGAELKDGITSQKGETPDVHKAKEQHRIYCETLHSLGVEIHTIPCDNAYPDGVFVEDTAVVVKEAACITRPGADSRKGETSAVAAALGDFYSRFEAITEPGTLDGGDVLHIENSLYVGLTERTNAEGVEQLKKALGPLGYTVYAVPVNGLLHLKSGISYMGNNTVLAVKKVAENSCFRNYEILTVPDHEAYAANAIDINGTIILPSGFPETNKIVQEAGFKTITIDVSEFKKVDGGLSCLSIRF